jgi:hypothetical protein
MTAMDVVMIVMIIAALRMMASAAATAISHGMRSVSTPQWMFAAAGTAFIAYLLYLFVVALATQS